MEKSLIIVESPAKAKTINKYLGKDYVVHASVGHIKNLPKSKIGVDIEGGFVPTFEIIEGKNEIVEKLRSAAEKADKIYLATDPDREGEAIAADIAEELGNNDKPMFRVLFHEITQKGISEAMASPEKLDNNLVSSQRARRIMDRIVGYKVSPVLWKTFFYGLSAGRVQSVALRLICEREEEIQAFRPQEYWSIIGEFEPQSKKPFYAKLFRIEGKEFIVPSKETLLEIEHKGTKDRYTYIASEESAQQHLEEIKRQAYRISDFQKRDSKRNPLPPFITSTLQQEASRKLRLSASKTMKAAQKLYEGQEIGGDGLVGLITYMRTDSTRLSADAVTEAREYILNSYGKEYVPAHPNVYKKKASQDAHEAIRPTSMKYPPSVVKKYLDKDLFKLYELIWNRFVACQMEAAIMETTTVIVEGGVYQFKATASRYKFRGFLLAYDDTKDEGETVIDEDTEMLDEILPDELAIGHPTNLRDAVPHRHETKPPPRYTEASLVKMLESLRIGRPSTYASIVGTIQDRKYVEQKERRLFALGLGMAVNKMLVVHFPDIFSVKFTAKMEDELDTIANGKQEYKQVMEDFYTPFVKNLDKVSLKTSELKKATQEDTGEVCEKCGKAMVTKWGRNGKFMACSGYPTCKNAKPLAEEAALQAQIAGIKCDLCGADMIVRSSKFGTFMGCSNYPKCTNTKPIGLGVQCPKCNTGDVIERKTKRKRAFYGCSRYPECDFASWDKPVNEKCDTCGSPYMLKKYSAKRGEYFVCPNCKAEVEKDQQASAVA